ncbi:MAG: tRNA (adenosine(37)-N6)-threonylcarbamoyltransferase complex ATPase subunit type 1 TsaE [Leeuwenhoekiella sp.]
MNIEYDLTEIKAVAEILIDKAKHDTILFYGEMGAGKTTLIKAIVEQLGSKDMVSSPTFSLVNEYEGLEQPIYHFDFYRLNDDSEIYSLGLEEYFVDKVWKFIEWPQKINSFLPSKYHTAIISTVKSTKRMLTFK